MVSGCGVKGGVVKVGDEDNVLSEQVWLLRGSEPAPLPRERQERSSAELKHSVEKKEQTNKQTNDKQRTRQTTDTKQKTQQRTKQTKFRMCLHGEERIKNGGRQVKGQHAKQDASDTKHKPKHTNERATRARQAKQASDATPCS